jgi:cytochrome P450
LAHAGYETTANTLAYCVYNIAAHPEVEARLLAEVDAYGSGRKVQYRDLDQVRQHRMLKQSARQSA